LVGLSYYNKIKTLRMKIPSGRTLSRAALPVTVAFTVCIPSITSAKPSGSKPVAPNIILILCDDLGYADLSCYGSLWNQTPEIDRMASEGLRFTDFYAGAPVCTPSRAGLMTGCYARRVDLDLDANNKWVLFPGSRKGINPKEILLPEVLKSAGYTTAIIGKWHLGDQPVFSPVRNGFDYWFGLPYSNDMGTGKGKLMLPLMQNETVVDTIEQGNEREMALLTQRYTSEGINWIRKNRRNPFFLYLAHTMPHNPVAAQEQYYNQTCNPKKGYGASVAEISWSTGKILDCLKKEKLAENTLVIFTSDNGGALTFGASNGILKGQKGQTSEGGIRVPCIAWWPGKIGAETTCNSPASVLDFYKTFASLANFQLNDQTKRDGADISDYLFHPGAERKPRPFFYWHVGYIHAVRYGDWKVNLLGRFSSEERQNILNSTYKNMIFPDQIELFNLRDDPGETKNVAGKHPDIVREILEMAEKDKGALGEYNNQGHEVRKTIFVESPVVILR
jgi:arylsulfatase A